MATPKFLYDLSPFIEQQGQFFQALVRHISDGTGFPIIEILTLLPIRFRGPNDRDTLLGRGNGQFDWIGGAFRNANNDPTTVTFDDYLLGQMKVELPADIEFGVQTGADTVTLSTNGSPIRILEIENVGMIGAPSLVPPFTLTSFEVGAESMVTLVSDSGGNSVIIDGRVRSLFRSLTTSSDSPCEKDWLLLQDNTSKKCLLVRSTNPVRRYPTIGEFDTKEEGLAASRTANCNGIQVDK